VKVHTILLCLCMILLINGFMGGLGWAGELEELKYQNTNLRIQNLSQQIQMTIQERDKVIEEMKKQGYTFDQNGNFTRPAPKVEKKEEPKKEPAKK
jgi:DNA-binding protein H-NS